MTRLQAIIENIRTNGKDPVYRKSLILSFLGHVLVLLVIPWMLQFRGGCASRRAPTPDDRPGESARRRRRVLVSRFVPKKRIITRRDHNSPIVWDLPDLEDSRIPKDIEEDTQARYDTDGSSAHRPGSPGGTSTTPGFPGGFPDGKVRFIRLEYAGEEWDDGMDSRDGADMNFLKELRKLTDVSRTAGRGESHPIRHLARYRKGGAPPFVYMTGSGRIDGVGRRDVEILRDYIRQGGMLFADCGSSTWHRSFVAFVRWLFPGVDFSQISDDDPIFRQPFVFPDGAPPFWHHGGFKAMGVKMYGRWVVFYHPGDMNDAWKTGRSGVDPELAGAAHRLGVNVVWYACRNYVQATGKYREKR